ncbi:hypothetical protein AB0P37_44345, partial [Streptomyces antimycoticus]
MTDESGPTGRQPRQRKQMLLRLDPAIHDALARWANDELRSANAQIEFLLLVWSVPLMLLLNRADS